ncbi:MAG: hypothetical protein SPL73_04410 [Cyanobacteriota bacterium]|nr:hypothetical protein [Cyanobacteriota bacterium]
MSKPIKAKKLSSPISTGGAGVLFENEVQSSFILLMLSKGIFNPISNDAIIEKIDLQAKRKGYELDDMVVHANKSTFNNAPYKMLTQIKRHISIKKSDDDFKEFIKAAWDDFNNSELFNANRDLLALITSALSANDCDAIYFILDQAQAANNFQDFYDRINRTNFSSENKIKKFVIIEDMLKEANNDNTVFQEQVWKFFKCFRVFIYDLHIKGICSSLLHTILEMHSPNNSHVVWCLIKDFVSNVNSKAGSIELSNIPDEIKSYFNNKNNNIYVCKSNNIAPILIKRKNINARDISLLFLLGSFNENNENDVEIVKTFIRIEYNEWISNLRNIIQEDNAPIFLNNGVWGIKDKKDVFEELKTCIYDEDIDALKSTAISVLNEIDPQYELGKEQRFCAAIFDKKCKYSHALRSGLAEALAIIGSYENKIKNCSKDKIINTIISILRTIFENSSWQLWATLSDYLPLLAEASPKEFISILNKENESVFKELYAQEGDGLTGRNYILGILRALETIAWDKKYLSEITIFLGYLSSIDPGGNHGNRPINSIKEIFIPWHAQTLASIEEQKNAIKCLNNEYPKTAWDVLISILPDEHQYATGTAKPKYRNAINKDWKYKITNKEYDDICCYYANFLIEQSRYNIDKLQKLIDILPKMPEDLFNKIINYLSEQEIIDSADDKKYQLWNELKTLVNHHIKYSQTKWAMKTQRINKIKKIIKILKPNHIYQCIRLFSNAALMDYELSKRVNQEDIDYTKDLRKIQYKKVRDILKLENSISWILLLLEKIENPYEFGFAVGKINDINLDKDFLPKFLTTDKRNESQFISGYIDAKFHYKKLKYVNNNFDWVESIDKNNWSLIEISKLYQYLSIDSKTLEMVEKLDKKIKDNYWQYVNINPYGVKDIIDEIINKMIIYKRKNTAIECLYFKYHFFKKEEDVNANKVIEVLNMPESKIEPATRLDSFQTVSLIEILQKDKSVDRTTLANIEWIYLNWLNDYDGHHPVALNMELASNPAIFCEIIQLIYKSENEEKKDVIFDKDKQKIAEHAWGLLKKWKTPPGFLVNETYSYDKFKEWFDYVTCELKKSGHLKVALYNIGEILYNVPTDSDGFWINKDIAALLNKKENEDMRHGFYIKTRNSRGVYWVDPEAKPEKELEAKYNKLAADTEAKGYARLATLLRELADSYAKDAERIIEEQKQLRNLD